MSSLYISVAFLCQSDFSVLVELSECEIQQYTGRVMPRKALFGLGKEINWKGSSIILTWVTLVFTVCDVWSACLRSCVCFVWTNWGASEGGMIAVLLPGAVEAQHKVLEEGMSFVEDRKTDYVDSLVHHIVQSE